MMSLTEFKWDVDNCNRCSLCKWVNPWEVGSGEFAKICPSVARYLYDAYSCQGRLDIAKAIIDGHLDPHAADSLAQVIYHCHLCGACDIMCKRSRDLDPLLVLKALREKLWEEGITPKALGEISRNVQSEGNVWGKPQVERARWAEGLDLKKAAEGKIEVLFWVGCAGSYQTRFGHGLGAILKVLRSAGVKFGILGEEERCCGSPVAEMGNTRQFAAIARENLKQFAAAAAGTIVTSCADCYGTIKVAYAEVAQEQGLEMAFEVLHITEYLERLLRAGRIQPGGPLHLKVTYHDPCHLGRLSDPFIPWEGVRGAYGVCTPKKELRRGTWGCYDPPRQILRAIPGVELVEMERVRENSWCCGAGGGMRTLAPEFARWTAEQRIAEAIATGAEALICACPWCEQNLAEAAGDRIAVHDIGELFAQSQERGP